MGEIIHPYLLYTLLVAGGAGVCLALPRGGKMPQLLGAILAAAVGGAAVLALTLKAGNKFPNVFFYVFALVALGSALRVITHPRPVYAALYFIMTVIASAGLFVILSAEFMAFALIIVYAGAILITYLFVIMLATQSPEEGEVEVLASYDTNAREPVAATAVGFLLLGLMTSMIFSGVPSLPAPGQPPTSEVLEAMPQKVERSLRVAGKWKDGDAFLGLNSAGDALVFASPSGEKREIPRAEWPEGLEPGNVESLGFNLLKDNPGTIEIAGVILLMAMLGAVVLSRKQVQLDEEAKRAEAHRLGLLSEGGPR